LLPIQDALATRTQEHLFVALQLIEELRWDVHVAPLAGAAADPDDRYPAAPREDQLVATVEIDVDRGQQRFGANDLPMAFATRADA
jgi:hypothetical protein